MTSYAVINPATDERVREYPTISAADNAASLIVGYSRTRSSVAGLITA